MLVSTSAVSFFSPFCLTMGVLLLFVLAKIPSGSQTVEKMTRERSEEMSTDFHVDVRSPFKSSLLYI